MLTTLGSASLAPVLGFCGGCCASLAITGIDTEPNLEVEYFWTDGPEPGTRCIGYVDWREEGAARLRRPDFGSSGNSHPELVPNEELPEMFTIDALVGTYLADRGRDGSYRVGIVTGVHGELDGGNKIELRVQRSYGPLDLELLPIAQLCVPGPDVTYDGPLPEGYTPPQ